MLGLFEEAKVEQIFTYYMQSNSILRKSFVIKLYLVKVFAIIPGIGDGLALLYFKVLFDAFDCLLGVIYTHSVVFHFLLDYGASQ